MNKPLLIEIPEQLQAALTQYLESRPGWTSDRVVTAALAHFLMQNQPQSSSTLEHRQFARLYLDTLFKG